MILLQQNDQYVELPDGLYSAKLPDRLYSTWHMEIIQLCLSRTRHMEIVQGILKVCWIQRICDYNTNIALLLQ